jgi:single-strand DNA-binding protein
MNVLHFQGYAGSDAKTNSVKGKQVINFSLCHTERFVDKDTGETTQRATWLECSLWSDSKVHEILKQGMLVTVEGSVYPKVYQDKQGKSIASLNCNVTRIHSLVNTVKKETEQPGTS